MRSKSVDYNQRKKKKQNNRLTGGSSNLKHYVKENKVVHKDGKQFNYFGAFIFCRQCLTSGFCFIFRGSQ